MTDRQLAGAVALTLIAAAAYAISPLFLTDRLDRADIPFSDRRSGPVIVELRGDDGSRGVYFLPLQSRVRDLLKAAGIRDSERFAAALLDKPLAAGMTIDIPVAKDAEPAPLRISPMENVKRLALGLPIDINGATLEDLMLISGIGEKTAEKIIQVRQERGRFKRLEELMEVKGIKEKRFQQLKPYLSVAEERRGSE